MGQSFKFDCRYSLANRLRFESYLSSVCYTPVKACQKPLFLNYLSLVVNGLCNSNFAIFAEFSTIRKKENFLRKIYCTGTYTIVLMPFIEKVQIYTERLFCSEIKPWSRDYVTQQVWVLKRL